MSSLVWHPSWEENTSNMWPNRTIGGSDVDLGNVWSAKSEVVEEADPHRYIKSIWSSNTSDTTSAVGETNISVAAAASTESVATPTNSPSARRSEVIESRSSWGAMQINQTTPWDVGEMEEPESEKRERDPMVWRATVDGTEIWEEYYARQHGKRRPHSENGFTTEVWSQAQSPLWSGAMSMDLSPLGNAGASDVFGPVSGQTSTQIAAVPGSGGYQQGPSNGVRPNMTRQQAQKYLTEMGYSLSDAIGALVRNQMDLSKALLDLQSKYRGGVGGGAGVSSGGGGSKQGVFCDQGTSRMTPATGHQQGFMGPGSASFGAPGTPGASGAMDMFFSDTDQTGMMDGPHKYGMADGPPMMRHNGHKAAPQSQTPQRVCMSDSQPYGSRPSGRAITSSNMQPLHQQQHQQQQQQLAYLNSSMHRLGLSSPAGPYSGLQQTQPQQQPQQQRYQMPFQTPLFGARALSQQQKPLPAAAAANMFSRAHSMMPGWPESGTGHYSPTGPHHLHMDQQQQPPRLTAASTKTMNNFPGYHDGASQAQKICGLVVRKVQQGHVDFIKQLCLEQGIHVLFHMVHQTQSLLMQLGSVQDAYRAMHAIQNKVPGSLQVEIVASQEEYMYYMSGIA